MVSVIGADVSNVFIDSLDMTDQKQNAHWEPKPFLVAGLGGEGGAPPPQVYIICL